MSAQGATLRRGTTHLPIWPVTALVAAAVVAIGISTLGGVRPQGSVAPVTKSAVGLENPGAYVTEAPDYVGFENPGAYITEAPAYVGISHVSPSLHSVGYVGFENPGAYITEAPAYVGISHVSPSLHSVGYVGFENPGAYGEGFTPTAGGLRPSGEPCMQCK